MTTRLSLCLLASAAALGAAGCARKPATPSADAPATAAPFKLSLQLDWVAEPEHGGFYQALARGFYRAEGLDVTIVPGGPNAFVLPKVATGQADLGQADSTNTLLQQAEGVPVLQVAAVFQDDPSGLLVNAASPVRRFEDLQGRTIIARPEWAFLPYLKNKYHIDFSVVPQNFSVAALIADREAVQQGYSIAEPYHVVQAGGQPPRFLATWDAGFRAYAVLITSPKFARAHAAELRAFLRASIHGWQDYLAGDPAPAHAALKAANHDNTDDFLAASRQLIIDGRLVTGHDPSSGPAQVGRITPERFQTQIDQLESLGILPKGRVTVSQAMTAEYLP